MAAPLDIRTLLVVFAVIRILQALGLVYVWWIHRKYEPARNWAIGSMLVAVVAFYFGTRVQLPSGWSIIPSNTLVFTGILVFNAGVVQACAGRVPWRAGALFIGGALLAQCFFTLWMPSPSGRAVVLMLVVTGCKSYAAICALRAPRGPLRGTQLLIAGLLMLEVVIVITACTAAVAIESASILQPGTPQLAFMLALTTSAFLLAVSLIILTSERTGALLEATLNHMNHGVAMFDQEQRLINCNERYGQIYGLSSSQIRPGMTVAQILTERAAKGLSAGRGTEGDRRRPAAAADEPSDQVEHLSDGRSIAISRRPMAGGGWVTTHEDITERRRAEARIAFMAHHDLLTGLPNRTGFLETIEDAAARLRGAGKTFALLMLDLDRFKNVNDACGHPAGDALLKETARRLKALLRETDTLARLGGDEFAIIQQSLTDERESAIALASRIVTSLSETYDIDGLKVSIGVSIGIAIAPQDGRDPSDLMKHADVALYNTKSKGRNGYCFFDAEMAAGLLARTELENDFRAALLRREFELHYQPIVDARTASPCAMEALVRWRHPRHGLIHPDRFIALAEETGLIAPLGALVLRTACADAASWPAHVKVAVNLSPLQFKHGNLLDTVLDALESSGLSPERLELEITETVLLENDTAHLTVMHQLMTIGVSFALDDFGTGYSSLGYLTTFPFSKIKIDRSFTRDLTKRTECAAIVLSVVTLADALDMTTVAEGIETRDQLELLRAAGINQVQGFLFGRPCPVAQLRFGCIDEAGPADESADGRRKGVAAHPGARAKMAAA